MRKFLLLVIVPAFLGAFLPLGCLDEDIIRNSQDCKCHVCGDTVCKFCTCKEGECGDPRCKSPRKSTSCQCGTGCECNKGKCSCGEHCSCKSCKAKETE